MMFTWGAEDIKQGVKYTQKGFKEVWMIGCINNKSENGFVLISLCTGLVSSEKYPSEIAHYLNDSGYIPLYAIENGAEINV